MSFLILEILFLMVLATLLGVALGYWWWRRQFEDVTVEYSVAQRRIAELEQRSDPGPGLDGVVARLAELERLITAGPNLSRLEAKLGALAPTDVRPLVARLTELEHKVDGLVLGNPKPPDLAPVTDAIGRLERRLTTTAPVPAAPLDLTALTPLTERLVAVEATLERLVTELATPPAVGPAASAPVAKSGARRKR